MSEFNRAQQSSLIKLYKANTVLWDRCLPAYRDSHMRRKALKCIQTAFQEEWGVKIEIDTIKSKIQNFRQAVSRENLKIEQAKRNGTEEDEGYVPMYPHWNELQFLQKVLRKREPRTYLKQDSQLQLSQQNSQSSGESDAELSWTNFRLQEMPSIESEDASQPLSQLSAQVQAIPLSPASLPCPTPATPQLQHTLVNTTKHSFSGRKRKDQGDDDTLSPCVQNGLGSKNARLQETTAPVQEEPNMLWARNLVDDLNSLKDEKRRKLLKIKISKLVLDELQREMEEETETPASVVYMNSSNDTVIKYEKF